MHERSAVGGTGPQRQNAESLVWTTCMVHAHVVPILLGLLDLF